MKLIVGLGNPGKQYEKTRHNAGFMVIDSLSKKLGFALDKSKCKAIYGIYNHRGEKIIFAKPQTFMNLSGESVQSLSHFYNVTTDDIIVIHDDLDLPLGKLRLRQKGSCGGQNGMRNIIDLLGTSEIKRIRLGISNDKQMDTKDYVLGKFSSEDYKVFETIVDKASEAVIYSLDNNFDVTMSKFN